MIIGFDWMFAFTDYLKGYYDICYRMEAYPRESMAAFCKREKEKAADEELITELELFYYFGLLSSYELYAEETKEAVNYIVDAMKKRIEIQKEIPGCKAGSPLGHDEMGKNWRCLYFNCSHGFFRGKR